jgi:hypothetical protein
MVGDHQPRKGFDFFIARPGSSELTCIDVNLVGCDDD